VARRLGRRAGNPEARQKTFLTILHGANGFRWRGDIRRHPIPDRVVGVSEPAGLAFALIWNLIRR
jgi:hypothetical protein